jgi:hypothetical protein
MDRDGSSAVRQNMSPNIKTYVLNSCFYTTQFLEFSPPSLPCYILTYPTLLPVIPNPVIIHYHPIFEAVSYKKRVAS